MVKKGTSWGVPCPPDIRGLFDILNAPVDIMVSSKGFLRADNDQIFMGDNDMPESHCRYFCEYILAPLEKHRHILFRVYKTKKGLRTIGLRSVPVPRENYRMFCESECDDNYAKVAKESNRYSCRLTPKPVRLGLVWNTSEYLHFRKNGPTSEFLEFFTKYSALCSSYAVCSYLKGPMPTEEPIASFIRFHDSITKAHESLPLA